MTTGYLLATAIVAAERYSGAPDVEEAAYDTISQLVDGRTDDDKAELYARIVDGCPPKPTFAQLVAACSAALKGTVHSWRH